MLDQQGITLSQARDFPPDHYDYRTLLQQEFQAIKTRNKAFSLRAFAKHIGLSPSRLSEVLSGKHDLAMKSAAHIAQNLQYDSVKTEYFVNLVQIRTIADLKEKERVLEKVDLYLKRRLEPHELSEDEFRAISEWQHLAIVTAAELNRFDGCVDRIAAALEISTDIAWKAVYRLEKLGLLELKDNRVKVLQATTQTKTGPVSIAYRRFHAQLLQKAILSVSQDPMPIRSVNATVLSFSASRMQEAKDFIADCRHRFVERFAEEGNGDQVYAASFVLFPLTRDLEGES